MTQISTTAESAVPASNALFNADLAPVPAARRTWSMWSIAALWVGMPICITTYTLASSLIKEGMSWKQAVLTVFLGNLIVLIPMTLNAHPGTAYGIPFPVLIRSSFGTLGANIPALLRALVACGWFGIQTWIGGAAVAFIGVAVTSATVVVFGEAIWDPVQLMQRFHSPLLAVLALFTLALATLSKNIAANVVSPANDFSNLAPRLISFRTGGIITGVIGIGMFPWKLYADPSGYIFTWLIGHSALLGPIGGIMIADYSSIAKGSSTWMIFIGWMVAIVTAVALAVSQSRPYS